MFVSQYFKIWGMQSVYLGKYEIFIFFLNNQKEIEELNQEIKFANKEKTIALTKAKDSLRLEAEKIKIDAYNVIHLNWLKIQKI